MKVTFLGTAAAEGIPSPFCSCKTCQHAREFRGPNMRKRASILINDDLLIDIGPDFITACAELAFSFADLKYVLVTHSHFDHFYPYNLEIRSERYMDTSQLKELALVAGPSSLQLLGQTGCRDGELKISRVPLLPFSEITLPPYIVTSIPATHALGLGDAMNYIVNHENVTILYAVDTGIYSDPVWNYLKQYQFQMIVLDVTNGLGDTSENHLNIEKLREVLSRFQEHSLLAPHGQVCATHFSHENNPPHSDLAAILGDFGVRCAFDGLVLEVADTSENPLTTAVGKTHEPHRS